MKLSEREREALKAALEATSSAALKNSVAELGPAAWEGELTANAISVALPTFDEHLQRLQEQFRNDMPEGEHDWLAYEIVGMYITVEKLRRASAAAQQIHSQRNT